MKIETFRSHINFEVLAGLFFEISKERYPSPDKIIQLTSRVIDPLAQDPFEKLHLKIGLLNAIRNLIKEVSPTRMYRSLQHRDDLTKAVIEAAEILENELEELEEAETQEME